MKYAMHRYIIFGGLCASINFLRAMDDVARPAERAQINRPPLQALIASLAAAIYRADRNAEADDAIIRQTTDNIRNLLQTGAAVDAVDEHGVTALMAAAMCGFSQIVAVLLEHGADRRNRDRLRRTALVHAQQCRLTLSVLARLRPERFSFANRGIRHGDCIKLLDNHP